MARRFIASDSAVHQRPTGRTAPSGPVGPRAECCQRVPAGRRAAPAAPARMPPPAGKEAVPPPNGAPAAAKATAVLGVQARAAPSRPSGLRRPRYIEKRNGKSDRLLRNYLEQPKHWTTV